MTNDDQPRQHDLEREEVDRLIIAAQMLGSGYIYKAAVLREGLRQVRQMEEAPAKPDDPDEELPF